MASPAPPYIPRIELSASVLDSVTLTKSIVLCGLIKERMLTYPRLKIEMLIKISLLIETVLLVFILAVLINNTAKMNLLRMLKVGNYQDL